MSERLPDKGRLRCELRNRRRALSEQAQRSAALAAASHVTRLPGWDGATCIALYLASDGEIDTAPLTAICRKAGKQLFLPVIEPDNSLLFRQWQATDPLTPNRFGIAEPPAGSPLCPPSALDIIIMPLVAWDRSGARLGMGGGFYDRTLEGVSRPLKVGLSHALQEVGRLPRDNWDVALDFVVTDTALHCCRGAEENAQS